ncbi:MAG: ABC transporter ATP-binding protein [Actinobacteria bacterium]|nr:ABC transporter ATP-binding protein [Actinomycetota bacterium]
MNEVLLQTRDLGVEFAVSGGAVHAVRGVDIDVRRGEVVGIVGESGSGKSATMLALLGLLAPNAKVHGSASFNGIEMIGAPHEQLRALRGGRIGMVFQDPMTSLNPVLTVGRQIAEAIEVHQPTLRPKRVMARVQELLEVVAIPNASERMRAYPHELSGGMRQRVMIAMAVANDPELIIADEPTTALDVTIQAQILTVLADLRSRTNSALVIITHDLGVVAGVADRVNVMYAGRVVERGPVEELFYRNQHPYTAGLLACLPRLDTRGRDLEPIGGAPPLLDHLPKGCAFVSRCKVAEPRCHDVDPQLRDVGTVSVACHVAPAATSAMKAMKAVDA